MRGTRCFTPTGFADAFDCSSMPTMPSYAQAGMHEIPDPRIQAACRQTSEMELSLSAA